MAILCAAKARRFARSDPARERPPALALFYMGDRTQASLWIDAAAAADPESGRYDWEPVEHAGRRMLLSDPGVPGGHRPRKHRD